MVYKLTSDLVTPTPRLLHKVNFNYTFTCDEVKCTSQKRPVK